jgi:hypothetical protein
MARVALILSQPEVHVAQGTWLAYKLAALITQGASEEEMLIAIDIFRFCQALAGEVNHVIADTMYAGWIEERRNGDNQSERVGSEADSSGEERRSEDI